MYLQAWLLYSIRYYSINLPVSLQPPAPLLIPKLVYHVNHHIDPEVGPLEGKTAREN